MAKNCAHPRKVVVQSERISRYIFEQKHLDNKSQEVFKVPSDLRLSTYRTTRITDQKIWAIATSYVEPARNKLVVGRADLPAEVYRKNGLDFEPDGNPHPRHTDIVGWKSAKPEDLEKRMALAFAAEWPKRP